MFVADLAVEERVVKISHFHWSQATCQEKNSLIPNGNLNRVRSLYSHKNVRVHMHKTPMAELASEWNKYE